MFTLVLICFHQGVFAQPSIEWQACYGGENYDECVEVKPTTDGGYIAVGNTGSSGGQVMGYHGGTWYDAWVVKLDSSRNIEWQKCFGGTFKDWARSVEQTADGGYVIGAQVASVDGDVSDSHGGADALVIKLDSAGELQWKKCYGGSQSDDLNKVIQTADGGYIFCGNTKSNDGDVSGNHNPGTQDAWVVKLDLAGGIEWQRCYGGSSVDVFSDIALTPDGGLVACGFAASPNDGDVSGNHPPIYQDAWVVKLEQDGDIEWARCYGGNNGGWAEYIEPAENGGYFFYGTSSTTNGDKTCSLGGVDGWLVKLNESGEIQWQQCIGDALQNYFCHGLDATSDGGAVVGWYAPESDEDTVGLTHYYHAYVHKFGPDGSPQWVRHLGAKAVLLYNVEQADDGGYLVACGGGGNTYEDFDCETHGGLEFWIVKLGATSDVESFSTDNNVHVYPNPASDILHVEPNSPTKSFLWLVNVLGQTCLIETVAPSSHTAINVSHLAKGLYVLLLDNGQTQTAERIVID